MRVILVRPEPGTPAAKAMFAERFLAAGWPCAEVAQLFDLSPNTLADLLEAA